MSLAVWLPLNGDLHNQGLNQNLTISNHNATIDNNGKIGKCYYFNGNQQWLQFNSSLGNFYNNDWSIACWIKPTDSTRSVILSEYNTTGASNISLELSASRYVRVYWNGTPDINFTSAGILPLNEWTHLTVTKQNRDIKVYFNGEWKQTYTYTTDFSTQISNAYPRIGDDYRGNSNNTVSYQGYLNDFRMYNHCLSPKEVEEIAKGLVLHYPLNNNGLGNINLALNTFYEMRPYTIPSYYIRTNNTSTDFFNLSVGDTYTCRVKITAGEKNTCLRIQFYTDNNTKVSISGNWITAGTTGYSTITSTLTTEQRNYSRMEILLSDDVNASTSGVYGELKLEKGSIATPWCPNNINTNIIYDTSGYCNNGTIIGNLNTTAPSPRYNCCIEHLDSCIDYIYRPCLSFLDNSGFTFSCWINPSNYSRTNNGTYGVGNQCILSQGRDVITSGTDHTYGASLTMNKGRIYFVCGSDSLYSNTTVSIGEWAHIVGVWTGTQKKIYINGILKNSANDNKIDWSEAQNSLVIGKMAYGKSSSTAYHPFVGKISDVRIYATALTDSQIKELYNTSMQIDSSGNIFARELVEL